VLFQRDLPPKASIKVRRERERERKKNFFCGLVKKNNPKEVVFAVNNHIQLGMELIF